MFRILNKALDRHLSASYDPPVLRSAVQYAERFQKKRDPQLYDTYGYRDIGNRNFD
jgi:hypothetical protein